MNEVKIIVLDTVYKLPPVSNMRCENGRMWVAGTEGSRRFRDGDIGPVLTILTTPIMMSTAVANKRVRDTEPMGSQDLRSEWRRVTNKKTVSCHVMRVSH